jgi:phytoene desaturase
VFADLYAAAGVRIEDCFDLVPVDPIGEYIFPDGARFTYASSTPEWLETVRNLDARDVDGFLRFMNLGARLFELSKDTFLRRRPQDLQRVTEFANRLEVGKSLQDLPLRYGWGNYHETVAAHFHSPYLRQLYDRYPTYVGSSPYESPATLAVIPFIEYAFGTWYIKGGLYRLVESLVELATARGVELSLNSLVAGIEREGEKVTGVRLADNELIEADVVVMNGDASFAPRMLDPGATDAGRYHGLPLQERSMSGFVMLIGIKRTMPELGHHTVYFSADYRREFSELFDRRAFPQDPTVYISAASRSDRSVMPGEGETLFVMANAPANDGDAWKEAHVADAVRRVFARLRASGFPEIENDIVVCDIWTPKKIGARYLMPGGAIYGKHSHGWKNAFLRPPNKDRHFKGLYYVGGSTHPGGGTPMALLSAEITCELIRRYESV